MAPRNDYICTKCDRLIESYGQPDKQCNCGGTWKLVFNEPPQIRPQHASCVEHVIAHNKKRMQEHYEEDMSASSEYQSNLRGSSHSLHGE